MTILIDIKGPGDYKKIGELRRWLEDCVGYELNRNSETIFGIGWSIVCNRHEFSNLISSLEVTVDDARLETLAALTWIS